MLIPALNKMLDTKQKHSETLEISEAAAAPRLRPAAGMNAATGDEGHFRKPLTRPTTAARQGTWNS